MERSGGQSLKNLLSYGLIGLFLIWCVIAFYDDILQIEWRQLFSAPEAVAIAIGLSLFNYLLRSLRWQLYLRQLGYRFATAFVVKTYLAGFAFTLSPGKVGEMVRGRYYHQHGVAYTTTAAAFFVERLLDLLAMVTLVLLAVATATDYGWLIGLTLGGLTALVAILIVTPWQRVEERFDRRSVSLFSRLSLPLIETLKGAQQLLTPKLLLGGLLLGVIAWGAEGVGLMVIGAMIPTITIDWATATAIYAVAIIMGALSFLPGGLGSTEAVMAALLVAHGYTLPDAMLLTLVCRLVTLWLAVAIGWGAVWQLRHSNRDSCLTTRTKPTTETH
ncbi:UPF0104 family protein [Ectothiorhodospiraceae bacterium BW-2]|nr:UPF0104 family protein [Ectothiorhodospiraceae bacterium BW-2]